MPVLVDLAYVIALVLATPLWIVRRVRRGRGSVDWKARLGGGEMLRPTARPRIVIHGVSVGEVNAIRTLVHELEHAPERPELVITATTATGYARARQLFAPQHRVERQPLDLSWCVRRFLQRIQPTVFAAVELEVWPNLTSACARRNVPFIVVNGRLSERSARRYARVRAVVRPSFRRLSRVLAQEATYAGRFVAMGTPEERVTVSGTMKWDGARVVGDTTDPIDVIAGARELATAMGIDLARPLVVAGSTAPEEHALLHASVPKGTQLLCAPRRTEWFDAAARDLPGCVRRSRGEQRAGADRFLLDSIGELTAAYALATVVVIGRSFGRRFGSDMMEPAAMGKAVVTGPAVEDFRATVDDLISEDAIVQCAAPELPGELERLVQDASARRELAVRARAVVQHRQGASALTARALLQECARCGAVSVRDPEAGPAGIAD